MSSHHLEELAAPEKCVGTPLHAWDQLQKIWTAMLMVRDSMLADERSSRAGHDLLRKTKIDEGGALLGRVRLVAREEGKHSSLLAHFSWREAFQVHFLDHILIAVVFLDIVMTVLSIICALFFI